MVWCQGNYLMPVSKTVWGSHLSHFSPTSPPRSQGSLEHGLSSMNPMGQKGPSMQDSYMGEKSKSKPPWSYVNILNTKFSTWTGHKPVNLEPKPFKLVIRMGCDQKVILPGQSLGSKWHKSDFLDSAALPLGAGKRLDGGLMLHRPLCKAQSLAQCFGHKNQPYRFRMSNHCVQHYLFHRYLPFTQIPCNNENREVNTFSKCCKRFGFPTCHRFVRLTRNLFPQGYSLPAKNRRERGCVSPPLPAS